MWKHLNHPNIVLFKGVTFDPLQLVSEWVPGGELREYIRNNRHANLIDLVSLLIYTLENQSLTLSAVAQRRRGPRLSSLT